MLDAHFSHLYFGQSSRFACDSWPSLLVMNTVSDTFIGRAKMLGGERPLLRENSANTDSPPCTTPIFNLFSLVVPQL